ncbi:hypothetical protein BH23CHL7_BH23CHL7_12630 [soil metagenome]
MLGLDVAVKAFEGGPPIRDAGQSRQLKELLKWIGAPLVYRAETPLPRRGDLLEYRRWDLTLDGHGERSAVEFESRLCDIQLQLGRWRRKQRDDPVCSLLIVVAATRANRRVLADMGDSLIADFPRLRTASVRRLLRAGRHPPTGLILLAAPARRNLRRGA